MAKKQKTETMPWYKNTWSKLVAFFVIIAGVVAFLSNSIQVTQFLKSYFPQNKVAAKAFVSPFPKKFQKDTLFILVTRFEDYISKKQTECFGRSLVS